MWFKRNGPAGSVREAAAEGVAGSRLRPVRSEQGRLEDLEDNFRRLERRFDRLQGELSRSVREQRELERENDDLRADLDNVSELEEGE